MLLPSASFNDIQKLTLNGKHQSAFILCFNHAGKHWQWFCLLAILLVITFQPGYSAEVKEQSVETFPMQDGGYISVLGDEGEITVTSWDKNSVKLKMTKRAWGHSRREAKKNLEAIEIDIQHSGDRLTIRQLKLSQERDISFWDLFDPDTWDNMRSSVAVDFELFVPREVDLRIENDEGDIAIDKINGDISVDVDEGDVNMAEIQFEDINISLDEGDLMMEELKGSNGDLKISTDEGEIRIEQADFERLKVECDEGDLRVTQSTVKRCDISTDEGDIDLDIDLQPRGRYTIRVDEGDVDFRIPNNPDVSVRLETEDGEIYTDFKLNVLKSEDEDGCRVRGELGNGSATIDIYSDDGRIELRSR